MGVAEHCLAQPASHQPCMCSTQGWPLAMSVRGGVGWGKGHMHPFVSSASLPRLSLDQTLFPSLTFLPCPALGSLPEREWLREGSIFLLAPLIEVTRPVSLCCPCFIPCLCERTMTSVEVCFLHAGPPEVDTSCILFTIQTTL